MWCGVRNGKARMSETLGGAGFTSNHVNPFQVLTKAGNLQRCCLRPPLSCHGARKGN